MLKASDIMTREVVTIKGFYTVDQAVRLMREKQVHALIVDRRTETDAYGIIRSDHVIVPPAVPDDAVLKINPGVCPSRLKSSFVA